MASTRLAEAVGYPGSSVAFAQLLSGMERDGLIAREVRGKRTYRIILAPGVEQTRGRAAGSITTAGIAAAGAMAMSAVARDGVPAIIGRTGQAVPAFDYDELARRLLIQVIRRLATPPDGQEGIVADLVRELSEARTSATTLTAENHALREQLSQVRRSLDDARARLDSSATEPAGEPELTRSGPVGEELTEAEVVLLERLVAPAHGDALDDEIQRDANAS
jgi:hypothetical protein